MKQFSLSLSKLLLLGGLAVSSIPAQAAWTEASTRHFVVISEGKPEDVRQFAEKLERFDRALRYVSRLGDVDLGPSNRLTVYVVPNPGAVERLAAPRTIGFYRARAGGSLAVVPKTDAYFDTFLPQAVLFHEYAHHLLLSGYSAVWPAWLSEGFAEFYGSAATQADGSVHIGLPPTYRAYDLLGTQQTRLGSRLQTQVEKLPLKQLLSLSHSRITENPQVYARGWLFVHHLNFEARRDGQLARYVAGLERGISSIEAGTAAFGELSALDSDLDAYLRKGRFRYLSVPASAIKVDTISLRTLSPGEQEVMPYRIRSKAGSDEVDQKQAHELASSVRQIAARFPDEAAVQVSLAQAELDLGNHAAAQAAADRAITTDPKRVEAHIYKGLAQMASAKSAHSTDSAVWGEVRQTFVAANRLDPDNPQPLVLFYQTFSASAQNPTANAVAGLHRACELAPQVSELQLMAGYQYLADAQVEQARKALARHAFRPHADTTRGDKVMAVLEVLDREGAAAAIEALVARGLKSW
jgi:tetratricopeptide (TPR) repeat protein